ncbi:MAG: hypothetical protein NTV22_00415 [bacterium]|nr:hypothetical protein [bacterium]
MRPILVFIVLLASALHAAVMVQQLVPWALADGGVGSFSVNGHSVDGDRMYICLDGINVSQIVRIDDLAGTQVRTQLVSAAQWLAASGKNQLGTSSGFGIVGDYLQMADPATDEIWRYNLTNGALFRYCDNAAIRAVSGKVTLQFVANSQPEPFSGEQVIYDSVSRGMYLAYDTQGNLYWGHNGSDSLYMRTSNGVLQIALASNAIYAATAVSNVGFSAICYAPDNKFYFMDSVSSSILSFDPHAPNPAATVQVLITEDELTNSIAGPPAYNISGLSWFGTGMGLTFNNEYGGGVYRIVPEPAGVLLAALFSVRLVQRVRPVRR